MIEGEKRASGVLTMIALVISVTAFFAPWTSYSVNFSLLGFTIPLEMDVSPTGIEASVAGSGGNFDMDISRSFMPGSDEGLVDFNSGLGALTDSAQATDATWRLRNEDAVAVINVSGYTDFTSFPWWIVGVEHPVTMHFTLDDRTENVSSVHIDSIKLEVLVDNGTKGSLVYDKDFGPSDAILRPGTDDEWEYVASFGLPELLEEYDREFELFFTVNMSMEDVNGNPGVEIQSVTPEIPSLRYQTMEQAQATRVAMMVLAFPMAYIGFFVMIGLGVMTALWFANKREVTRTYGGTLIISGVLLLFAPYFLNTGFNELVYLLGFGGETTWALGGFGATFGGMFAVLAGAVHLQQHPREHESTGSSRRYDDDEYYDDDVDYCPECETELYPDDIECPGCGVQFE